MKNLSVLIIVALVVLASPIKSMALFEQTEEQPAEEVKKPTKVNFVDEGEKNASFSAFRQELLKRLEQKDAKYLASIIDPNLKSVVGAGADEFKKFYNLDKDASKSIIWRDLKKILSYGGVFTDEGFCAPYITCTWPDGVEMAGMGAIIGKDVKLHQSPNPSSPVVGTLEYNIVKTTYNSAALRAGWKAVQTLDGRKGYVKSNQIMLSNDYRAFFKEKNGKWYMTVFITG